MVKKVLGIRQIPLIENSTRTENIHFLYSIFKIIAGARSVFFLTDLVKVLDWNSFQTNQIRFRNSFYVTWLKINPRFLILTKIRSDSIRLNPKLSIRMNPRSEWFKLNSQSELIRIAPTSHSLGLKNGSGFIRIQSFGLTRIKADTFSTDLHKTRLKTFFVLTRMSSDWCGYRFWDKSDCVGIHFNPKL